MWHKLKDKHTLFKDRRGTGEASWNEASGQIQALSLTREFWAFQGKKKVYLSRGVCLLTSRSQIREAPPTRDTLLTSQGQSTTDPRSHSSAHEIAKVAFGCPLWARLLTGFITTHFMALAAHAGFIQCFFSAGVSPYLRSARPWTSVSTHCISQTSAHLTVFINPEAFRHFPPMWTLLLAFLRVQKSVKGITQTPLWLPRPLEDIHKIVVCIASTFGIDPIACKRRASSAEVNTETRPETSSLRWTCH